MKKHALALCLLLISVAGLIPVLISYSTPLNWGDDSKPARWPEGKKITVWVPPSIKDGVDRAPFVREGIMRWRAEMLTRNITINVPNQQPPPSTPNVVNVTFKPAGSQLAGDGDGDPKLASGYPEGLGGCGSSRPPLRITSGEIILLDSLPATTASQKEILRNLGAHEMCHVLGLGDDSAGTVTKSSGHGGTPEGFNAQDLKEITTLYPKTGEAVPKAGAQPGGGFKGNFGPNAFPYTFTYDGPPDGHVPLVVLFVEASVVDSVIAPPGWVTLNPADPLSKSLTHPFYADYMTSCSNSGAPWKPGVKTPLAFRALTPADELSAANPVVSLGLTAHSYQVGPIQIWSGDESQYLPGPIPAPPPIPGDINHDGHVNVTDLLAVINAWGPCAPPCPPTCPADVTGDCNVNVSDLLLVITNWG